MTIQELVGLGVVNIILFDKYQTLIYLNGCKLAPDGESLAKSIISFKISISI